MNLLRVLNEASDYKLKYNSYYKKLTVYQRGKKIEFRNISQKEYDKLNNGLNRNPGTGDLHYNAFYEIHAPDEINGDIEQALNKVRSPYYGMTDDEAYDADLKKTYPELK